MYVEGRKERESLKMGRKRETPTLLLPSALSGSAALKGALPPRTLKEYFCGRTRATSTVAPELFRKESRSACQPVLYPRDTMEEAAQEAEVGLSLPGIGEHT